MSVARYRVPCTPPAWARGGHAQTVASHFLPAPGRPTADLAGARERTVALTGGDALRLYELPGTSGVRVHLFHGLSGDVDSNYMRGAAAALGARGHEVWAVNHRGCGSGFGLARQPYHSGRTEDLSAVLAASRADAPGRVHLVVGFSLSGNLALLHAGRHETPRPDGILAVNPPVDLLGTSVDIGRGLNRLYELRFMRRLSRAVHARHAAGLSAEHREVSPWMSLVEFDDRFTAPECGFSDGRDYYARCSAGPHLARVETPAVILTAADDPFVDARIYERLDLSDAVTLHVEPSGGHVGYVARHDRRWIDAAVVHYVEALAAR